MPWKRTTSLVAVAAVAVLGLTACQSEGADAKGTPSAAPSATTQAPGDGAGSATPDAPVTDGVKKPDDLPAGLPLPSAELTSVTGSTGAYVLTFTAKDPRAVVAEYRKTLEGAQYTVVDIGGVFSATSDKTSVSVATSSDTVVLTLATLF
ncbi:hypothetical protein [Streptomyces sp. NBC_00094]|uniref:hypothetical protein n=1 Tax=Streptomyces sp. NBC_00094 TaxID=2903620 RepID=UPI002256A427|nr:hypothetical protein [Streptomyces sp. NBC_00094]MCX5394641.1 hypothetical protein [Streptomyces sp. NBC_00094]